MVLVSEVDLCNCVSLNLYCYISGIPGERKSETRALMHAAGASRKCTYVYSFQLELGEKHSLS